MGITNWGNLQQVSCERDIVESAYVGNQEAQRGSAA